MTQKTLCTLLFLIVIVSCLAQPVLATPDWGGARFSMEEVLQDVDHMAVSIIAAIRTLAAIITVVLVLIIGINIWKSEDGFVLRQVKNQLVLLFIGLTLIFTTEPIVRFIFGLFNW